MRRSRLLPYVFMLFGVVLNVGAAGAASEPISLAIEDFSYRDTSGEPADQTAAHDKRLQAFMAALRRDVGAEPRYRLVPAGTTATLKIVGGIQKMSTLVQWAKVALRDVAAGKVVMDKLYTFRGDNDEAWDHAETFVFQEIRAALAAAQSPPIAIAVFDFELEDMTAAPADLAASDAATLAELTNAVRERLAESGRYRLIDLGGASADAVKAHALRDCGGCDAEIARTLGADQSLIGVVRRVSRTEYTLGFQIRDVRTGTVVTRADSGLRMGADYSWKRGAVRLVADRLIEDQSRQ